MARSPMTSSERRGILAIGLVSLLIIISALWLDRCGRKSGEFQKEEIEILIEGKQTVPGAGKENTEGGKRKLRKTTDTSDSLRSTKGKPRRTYRKRSFLDEPVSR